MLDFISDGGNFGSELAPGAYQLSTFSLMFIRDDDDLLYSLNLEERYHLKRCFPELTFKELFPAASQVFYLKKTRINFFFAC